MNIMIIIDSASLTPSQELSVQYHWSVSAGSGGGSATIIVEADNIMNNHIINLCVAEANAAGFPVGADDTKILMGDFYTL